MASQPMQSSQCDCLGACQGESCKSCYLDSIINGLNRRLQLTEGKLDQSPIAIIDKAIVELINYCCDIICRKGLSSVVSVDSIYSHVQKLNSEAKVIVKSPKDLKDFLCKYPHMFNINDDKISLKNPTEFNESRIKWIRVLLQYDFPEVNKSIVNALQFYSDVLYYIKQKPKLPIVQLVTHRTKAREEVQIMAKNPAELKSLLTAYPQIFTIHGESVCLTDAAIFHKSNYRWLEDLIRNDSPDKKQESLLRRAVDYYLQILLKVESNNQLSISRLFSFRSVAPLDIKELTATKEELMFFLSNYSEIFTLKNNQVKVNSSLLPILKREKNVSNDKKSAKPDKKASSDNQPAEGVNIGPVKQSGNKKKKDDPGSSENKGSDSVSKEVFEEKVLYVLKQFSYVSAPLEFVMKEIQVSSKQEFINSLSKCKSLLLFDNRVIMKDKLHATTLSFVEKDAIVPNSKSTIAADRLKYQEVVDYVKNFLLETVGIGVCYPVSELVKGLHKAPAEVCKVINSVDLAALFKLYPDTFFFKDNQISFKDSIDKYKDKAFSFFLWVLREKIGVGVPFPICRLKIYMDLAAFHTDIHDFQHLRKFLCGFPAVFHVDFTTVTLKNNFKEPDTSEGKKDYIGYEKLLYFESYSTTASIEYYSRVLKRFCFNLEVPVSYLFGYRSFAPVEVFSLAKDANDLKKFLASHPDIFNLREDKVSLSKNIAAKENEVQSIGSTENSAIQFYISVLNKVNQSNECAIVTMFGYQYLAPPEVKGLIKTPIELKEFLCKYPHAFSVNNDLVTLVRTDDRNNETYRREESRDPPREASENSFEPNSQIKNELSLNQLPVSSSAEKKELPIPDSLKTDSRPISKKETVVRAIRFYSNLMFKKGPNSIYPVAALISHKSEATEDVKQIAKSPADLFSFLSKFPQIFRVDNAKKTVVLTDMIGFYKNQRSWIKDLLPKYHQSTTNHESVVSGIQFYSNIVFERGSLTIKSLFGYRKTAMEDVQSLAKNIIELKNFLSMYPEIFIVINDNVSLTEEVFSQKNQPKWIEQVVSDCDLSFLDIDSGKNPQPVESNDTKKNMIKDIDTMSIKAAVQFFKSVLETSPQNVSFSVSKLFEYMCIAPKEVKEFLETPMQLKDICVKNPAIFTIKNDIVMLNSTKEKEKKKKDKKLKQQVKPGVVADTQPIVQQNDTLQSVTESVKNKSVEKSEDKYLAAKIITFYCNIFCKKGLHVEHFIDNLFGHLTKAPNDVREALKNSQDLKAFMSKFPQLFTVDNNKKTVRITDLSTFRKNQCRWIEELFPKHLQSAPNREAIVNTVLFYSGIIFEKSPDSNMAFNMLFSHRGGAPADIKLMVKSILELNSFLLTFPLIFAVNKDTVSLTPQATIHKSQPKWVWELVNGNETPFEVNRTDHMSTTDMSPGSSLESAKQEKKAVHRAIQYYYRKMLPNVSNKGFTLSQLLSEAPSEVREVANDVNSLSFFLSKYQHIFTLKDGIVFLKSYNEV